MNPQDQQSPIPSPQDPLAPLRDTSYGPPPGSAAAAPTSSPGFSSPPPLANNSSFPAYTSSLAGAGPATLPQVSPPPIAGPEGQVIGRLKEASNVLITVSSNPSVDQLAAAIGITLVLNKLGKHATAVFSGEIPSAIQFLQPEKTIEKNTDSLRDFIIALDKSKADKLRYKIEDRFVKIFITPYHTSLSDKDLEFSQGDLNVDVIVALGVLKREQLDQAITAHGGILHDATIISINNKPGADIGNINWNIEAASSLSEIMVGVSEELDTPGQKPIFDEQIATAFLTGVVAETDRFSNTKTTPVTMNTAAKLMNAGANQQLVANKLAEPKPIPKVPEQPKPAPLGKKPPGDQPPPGFPPAPPPINKGPIAPPARPSVPSGVPPIANVGPAPPVVVAKPSDGSMEVPHKEKMSIPPSKTLQDLEEMMGDVDDQQDENEDDQLDKIHIDDQGTLRRLDEMKAEQESLQKEEDEKQDSQTSENQVDGSKMVLDPPTMGGALSGNTIPPNYQQKSSDPLGPPINGDTLINRDNPRTLNPIAAPFPDKPPKTLTQIEDSIEGVHQAAENSEKPSGLPENIVGPDTGLPPDQTANSGPATPPPPVPPPIVPS